MIAHDLQFCVIDPEGDYAEFPAVMVGDAKHEPSVSEIMDFFGPSPTPAWLLIFLPSMLLNGRAISPV